MTAAATVSLSDLLARIEQLSEPDRSLDILLWDRLRATDSERVGRDETAIDHSDEERFFDSLPYSSRYTASIDAASELADTCLEGASWRVEKLARYENHVFYATVSARNGAKCYAWEDAYAATGALAILKALLLALRAIDATTMFWTKDYLFHTSEALRRFKSQFPNAVDWGGGVSPFGLNDEVPGIVLHRRGSRSKADQIGRLVGWCRGSRDRSMDIIAYAVTEPQQ